MVAPKKKPDNVYCPMLMGAILGEIAGSIYEFDPHKSTDINLQDKRMDYTDDTIMTIAVAEWILNDKRHTTKGLVETMQQWGRKYPHPMGHTTAVAKVQYQSQSLPSSTARTTRMLCVCAFR